MKKIAVFTDIHGNLDALRAIYHDMVTEGITEIYHLGDSIAIGPEPKATLDFALDKGMIMLKGNHEIYYTDIIRTGKADVSEAELAHQKWVATGVGEGYYEVIDKFPYDYQLDVDGVKMYFCHYPFTIESGKFKGFIELDEKIDRSKFEDKEADLYFFGHQHNGSDYIDSDGIRFINLNSAGATRENETYYAIVEINSGNYKIINKAISYEKYKVIEKIDDFEVPDRDIIKRIFFGLNNKQEMDDDTEKRL